MKKTNLMIFVSFFVAQNYLFGQCLTTTQIDYSPPTIIGDSAYFFKFDQFGGDGFQLWKSNADLQNQVFVKALGGGDNGHGNPDLLTQVNNQLFFVSGYNVGTNFGTGLFKSDGTKSNTILVKKLHLSWSNLFNVNGTLFFLHNDGIHGIELWKSDGTETGTVLVKDIRTGSTSSFSYSPKPQFTNANGILFFVVDDGINGSELWKSDGTDAGTVLVKNINAGSVSSHPNHLKYINGIVYFSAVDGTNGNELWRSDGTSAGTYLLQDINPGAASSNPFYFEAYSNQLIFFASSGLYKSDGTSSGTTLISSTVNHELDDSPIKFIDYNGSLYFSGYTPGLGSELWKTNGTSAGTVLVKDIIAGRYGSNPAKLFEFNGLLYFQFNGYGPLWKSDGTTAGTVLVHNLSIRQIVKTNNSLFFANSDGVHYQELWKSDGTSTGASMVKDIALGRSSDPNNMLSLNNVVYFSANDNNFGTELWRSDGTSEGTKMVKNLLSTFYLNSTFVLKAPKIYTLNNKLLFFFKDGDSDHLYKSDGSADGTKIVKESIKSDMYPDYRRIAIINNKLFFSAQDLDPVTGLSSGDELWKTDGTTQGTELVKDINPGYSNSIPNSSSPSNFIDLNGILYFFANNGVNGNELWRSDGTNAGTTLVKDIEIGIYSSVSINSVNFTKVNQTLYFNVYRSAGYFNLYKTDGTPNGTSQVSINRTYNSINYNGVLYFNSAYTQNTPAGLWKTDGTTTTLVKEFLSPDITEANFGIANNTLLFFANDLTNGSELWKSDGTTAGTTLVKDISPGSGGSVVLGNNVISINGIYYFVATNGSIPKLWRSDATTAGTTMVGSNNGATNFQNVNNKLYFYAYPTSSNIGEWNFLGINAPTINVSPQSPVLLGTSVTLTASNCSGTVSWDNNLGVGTSKTVTPTENIIYRATCQSGSCLSNTISVEVKVSICPPFLSLSSTSNPTGDISSGTITKSVNAATGTITATNKITGANTKATYQAKSIILNAGFKADKGTVFKAEVGGCQ